MKTCPLICTISGILVILTSGCTGQSEGYATYTDNYLNVSFEYPSEMIKVKLPENTSAFLLLKGSDYALFWTGGNTNRPLNTIADDGTIGMQLTTDGDNNFTFKSREIRIINNRQWLIEIFGSKKYDLIGYVTLCSPTDATYPNNVEYIFGLNAPFGKGSDYKYTTIMDHLAETFNCP